MSVYTVGTVLPNGATVTSDTVATLPDGSTVETMVAQYPDGTVERTVVNVPGPNTPQANWQTINSRVHANLTTIENWIAANPTGAVLTAGQTLALAKMLVGLCRLTLNELSTVGGA